MAQRGHIGAFFAQSNVGESQAGSRGRGHTIAFSAFEHMQHSPLLAPMFSQQCVWVTGGSSAGRRCVAGRVAGGSRVGRGAEEGEDGHKGERRMRMRRKSYMKRRSFCNGRKRRCKEREGRRQGRSEDKAGDGGGRHDAHARVL